jgi:hypothetical protein
MACLAERSKLEKQDGRWPKARKSFFIGLFQPAMLRLTYRPLEPRPPLIDYLFSTHIYQQVIMIVK